MRAAPQAVDRREADGLQHGHKAASLFGVEGPVSMIALTTPLSGRELTELDEFLMSDATPKECMAKECMDITAVDGCLSSLAIGPV
jgi:hypothetical protein